MQSKKHQTCTLNRSYSVRHRVIFKSIKVDELLTLESNVLTYVFKLINKAYVHLKLLFFTQKRTINKQKPHNHKHKALFLNNNNTNNFLPACFSRALPSEYQTNFLNL